MERENQKVKETPKGKGQIKRDKANQKGERTSKGKGHIK